MISDFYNGGYSIIVFTNSTAHVQRKETGIQGMLFTYLVRNRAMAQMARVNFVCVTVITCLHSNRNMHDNCAAMHS